MKKNSNINLEEHFSFMLDLAVIELLNSKIMRGDREERIGPSSLRSMIKTSWLRLDAQSKAEFYNKLISIKNSETEYHDKITNKQLVEFFQKHVMPFKSVPDIKYENGLTLIPTIIWTKEICAEVKKIAKVKKQISTSDNFVLNNLYEEYQKAIENFFVLYGKPTKAQKRILKARLKLNNLYNTYKQVIEELQGWKNLKGETSLKK